MGDERLVEKPVMSIEQLDPVTAGSVQPSGFESRLAESRRRFRALMDRDPVFAAKVSTLLESPDSEREVQGDPIMTRVYAGA